MTPQQQKRAEEMNNENVLIFSRGNVGYIALDTPPKNVITEKTFRDIDSALDEFENDSGIETFGFCGMNGNFSAGANLEWMHALQKSPEKARETVDFIYRVGLRIGTCKKPTFAVIEKGKCSGIGLEIMSLCDYVAVMEKNMGTIEFAALAPRYGFMLGLGIVWQMTRKIGIQNTVALLFDSETFGVAKAHHLCMVDYFLPGDDFSEAVHHFAQEMLAGRKPPKKAFRLDEKPTPSEIKCFERKCGSVSYVSKVLAVLEACGRARTLEEAMNIEKRFFLELLLSDNAKKKVGDFLEETMRKKSLRNNVAAMKIA